MEASGETLVMAGCLLYPDLVHKLLQKVGKQQWTSVLKKSYFEGYQAKAWQEICQHALFAEVDEDIIDEAVSEDTAVEDEVTVEETETDVEAAETDEADDAAEDEETN